MANSFIPMIRLDALAEVRLGRQRSPKNHSGDHMRRYMRAANVGWSGLLLDDVKEMNFSDAEMGIFRLAENDLLLNEASGSPHEVGKPAIWKGEIADCAFQNTLLRVRPRAIDPEYLLHYFRYAARTGIFAAASKGVGIRHLGREALSSLPVPCPSKEEQRRVVTILKHADALCTKRAHTLAALSELTEAIFLDMFGDPTENPMGWKVHPFGDMVREFRYGTSNKSSTTGHPALRIPNVIGGRLDLHEIKTVPVTAAELDRLRLIDGDILFVRTNGNPNYVGRCAVIEGEAIASSSTNSKDWIYASYLIRARLDHHRLRPTFVREFMLGRAGRKALLERSKTSAGQYNINIDGLASIRVPIPPMSLQDRFDAKLKHVVSLRRSLTSHLHDLNALSAVLQYRAFRGEL